MDRARTSGRMAAEGGRGTCGIHAGRISSKQRFHLAALLTLVVVAALPLQAQSDTDINFDPTITQAEFEQFTSLVAQAIYATPVEPAHARGILGFEDDHPSTGAVVEADPVPRDEAWRLLEARDACLVQELPTSP